MSSIWLWGEDLQLKEGNGLTTYYYCYICERLKKTQELSIMSNRRFIMLTHLIEDYNMDKATGLLKKYSKTVLTQLTIEDYPAKKLLIWSHNFDTFKQLLVQWVIYCHIAFFQFENIYFCQLLFFIYPGLKKYLPKASKIIYSWVIKVFKTQKGKLRKELKNACSIISISFDL